VWGSGRGKKKVEKECELLGSGRQKKVENKKGPNKSDPTVDTSRKREEDKGEKGWGGD